MFSKIFIVIIAILAIIFSPFLIIWGLNTLFPVLAIPYNLETWAAIILVRLIFETRINYKS